MQTRLASVIDASENVRGGERLRGEERQQGQERLRIDKWLWAARFYKTRSLAAQAVESGRARLHGERVKPSKDVRAGDRIKLQHRDMGRNSHQGLDVVLQFLTDGRNIVRAELAGDFALQLATYFDIVEMTLAFEHNLVVAA